MNLQARVTFPTYFGHTPEHADGKLPEWSEPTVPVIITPDNGLRLLLGADKLTDAGKPDIYIERRPGGWAIFIHPESGDPAGTVYILDDGRTFLHKEFRADLTILNCGDDVPPELDRVRKPRVRKSKR